MTTYIPSLSLLQEVRTRRRHENFANVFKLVGILSLALVAACFVVLLAAPNQANGTTNFILHLFGFLGVVTIQFAFYFVFAFWPFLLYFWAGVKSARQWTLLSLLQTSIETGKPLQNIVRAYATHCSCGYAARLNRFAAALDAGYSPDAAIREHQGLFRYDVAGMVRLGDTPETLRSLDTVAQDERAFAPIQTNTIVRVVYLCTLVIQMFLIMSFVLTNIAPQFQIIFNDFSTDLPTMTTFVLAVSGWFVTFWYLITLAFPLIALLALAYLILQTNVMVFRPVGFRRIFRSTDSAKFLRIFAVGLRQRFSIPAILERYRRVVPSNYLRQKGTRIQKSVEQGGDWIDAVYRAGFINGPETALLQSAQRTGNTSTVLEQLALGKERSQIRKDDLFSKLAFIPLIFLLGGIIGVFVVAMFMPLITLITDLAV